MRFISILALTLAIGCSYEYDNDYTFNNYHDNDMSDGGVSVQPDTGTVADAGTQFCNSSNDCMSGTMCNIDGKCVMSCHRDGDCNNPALQCGPPNIVDDITQSTCQNKPAQPPNNPVVYRVWMRELTADTARVAWRTDREVTTKVYLGFTISNLTLKETSTTYAMLDQFEDMYTFTDLVPNSSYVFELVMTDAAGNSTTASNYFDTPPL